jgi:hypothetical protein
VPADRLGSPALGAEEFELPDGAEVVVSEPDAPGLLDVVHGEVAVQERDGVVVATALGPARLRRTPWFPAPSPDESPAARATPLSPNLADAVHRSAARSLRAAAALGIALEDLQSAAAAWAAVADAADAQVFDELVTELLDRPDCTAGKDLAADAEEGELIEAWLDAHGSGDHILVGPLVARGLGPEWLDALARRLPGERLSPALAHLGATLAARSLAADVGAAARQISHLVAPSRSTAAGADTGAQATRPEGDTAR